MRWRCMNYLTGYYTEKGVRKESNQDSMMVLKADCNRGKIIMAAVCDGMGGWNKGELASYLMINSLKTWFTEELPELLGNENYREQIEENIKTLILKTSDEIRNYGLKHGNIQLGTTLTGVIIIDQVFTIYHVGDSRCYLIDKQLQQLTTDHSYIQQLINEKKITKEQAKADKRRNLLLQCIGDKKQITIDFIHGTLRDNDMLLFCSDGFYHTIGESELIQCLRTNNLNNALKNIATIARNRYETDDISALVIKVSDVDG